MKWTNQLIGKILAVMLIISMLVLPCSDGIAVQSAAAAPAAVIELHNCSTKKLTMIKGKTYTLKSSVILTGAGSKTLIYSTSNKKVAAVSKKGKISAKKTGSATIKVKLKSNPKIYQKIKVKVVKASAFRKIRSVKVKTAAKELLTGQTRKLSAKITPAKASNKNLTWKSSNTSVASVDSKGVVTAKMPGSVTIRASANDGSKKSGKITLTVKEIPVQSVAVFPQHQTLKIGQSQQMTASVSPANAGSKAVSWSSANSAIARITADGIVTGVSEGQTTVKASAADGSGKYGTAVITVERERNDVRFEYFLSDAVTVSVKDGDKISRPEDPASELAVFDGWYTDTDYAEEFSFDKSVTESVTVYAHWIYKDSDHDGILDIYEQYFGIADGGGVSAEDYDGDGISDFDEINVTKTDPSKKDTDDNGVEDGDEDADEDGLTNLEEYALGTSPDREDTDGDGLKDGDEVNIYKTDPLEKDTDGDGITDGDEVTLGLDPLNAISDGVTLDGDRTFSAELSEDQIQQSLLAEENVMRPSFSSEEAVGIMDDHVSLYEAKDSDLAENRSIVGKIVTVDTDYADMHATLTFQFDREQFSDAELCSLTVCKAEDGEYVPLDATLDRENGTLSAEVTKPGTYFVLNIAEFLNAVGINMNDYLKTKVEAKIPEKAEELLVNKEIPEETAEMGEISYYCFTPEQADVYSFYFYDSPAEIAAVLYDSAGNVIAEDTGANIFLTEELEAGQTYYLAAGFYYVYDKGSFWVGVEQMQNGEEIPKNFDEIQSEETKNVNIHLAGNIKYYRFVPEEDTIYSFYSESEEGYDTQGILLDAEGQVIASDDDGGENGGFLIKKTLTAGEVYYFGAMFYSASQTGSFQVHLEPYTWEGYQDFIDLNQLSDWLNITVFLGESGYQYYRFVPESTGNYVISSEGDYDTVAELYDAEGEYISGDDDGGEENNFKLSVSLTENETYYYKVKLYSSSSETVSFRMRFGFEEAEDAPETVVRSVTENRSEAKSAGNGKWQSKKEVLRTIDLRTCPTKLTEAKPAGYRSRAAADSTYKGQADIVFAIDTTGSMSDAIQNVAENVSAFVTQLSESYNVQVNFALVDFKDIEEDGANSTVVVKNGASNWFSSARDFKAKVNSLTADGGGDDPESAIDALETARRLNFRSGAEKFVILITDADYKIANNYGIYSMDSMISKLRADGINVSVVSASGDRDSFKKLYTQTGGIWADIYGNFSAELLKIADMIGNSVSSGSWVLLRGFQYVKLDKEVSASQPWDTDGDSIYDHVELGSLKEVSVGKLTQLYLKLLGVSEEFYTGSTTVKYYDYITNPVLKDTDYDGMDDKWDPKPTNSTFHLRFHNYYADTSNVLGSVINSDVVKKPATVNQEIMTDFSYEWFFNSNDSYNGQLAKVSLMFAAAIYKEPYISGLESEFGARDIPFSHMEADDLLEAWGMGDTRDYSLNKDNEFHKAYKDQHVSEFAIGHRKVTCQGETREIVQITVRGTNSTLTEWQSNFDVGSTRDFGKISGWKHVNNHMGFDITANRILDMVHAYVKKYTDTSVDSIYWITGHSRGASIANILGADLVDEGNKVFAYTFATPNTTTASNRKNYAGIYSFVNEDDFVPKLPLASWNFGTYGKTAVLDVSKSMEKEWEAFTGIRDYDPDTLGLKQTIESMENLTYGRNGLYEYSSDSDYICEKREKNKTLSEAEAQMAAFRKSLPSNFNDSALPQPIYRTFTLKWVDRPLLGSAKTYYGYTIHQTPEYFLQIMASIMANKFSTWDFMNGKNIASAFDKVRRRIILSDLGGIKSPHYTETYYIIVKYSKESDFK